MLLIGGCGVTDLQLRDFFASTLIRVSVSGAASVVQSLILDTVGGGT
jgi:hypothetical protein